MARTPITEPTLAVNILFDARLTELEEIEYKFGMGSGLFLLKCVATLSNGKILLFQGRRFYRITHIIAGPKSGENVRLKTKWKDFI